METWVCQEHFILEKEDLQKPLRTMEYFSLFFYYYYFKDSTVSFENAIFLLLQDNLFQNIWVFSYWKCKSQCEIFLWPRNGGFSPVSFALWKFHGALFQLEKERKSPKQVFWFPHCSRTSTKTQILEGRRKSWNTVKASAWITSSARLKCLLSPWTPESSEYLLPTLPFPSELPERQKVEEWVNELPLWGCLLLQTPLQTRWSSERSRCNSLSLFLICLLFQDGNHKRNYICA